MTQFPYNIILVCNLISWLIIYIKNPLDRSYHYFTLFIIFAFLNECIMTSYKVNFFIEPQIMIGTFLNLFIITQFLYFCFFFYRQINNINFKRLIKVACIIIMILSVYFFSTGELNEKMNMDALITYSFAIIIFTLLLFIDLILEPSMIPLFKDWIFYLVLGQLIWNAMALFRFIPVYLLDEIDEEFLKLITNVFNYINIITYLLYFVAFICLHYQKKLKLPT